MSGERSAVVGLQITDQLLRVTRLEFQDTARLTDAAELRLPAGIVSDGRIEDEHAVTQLLHRVWEQMSFHWEPVIVALGSSDALLMQAELDDVGQTSALLAEVGPRALREQVVAQLVTSHHAVAPVAVALRSSVDRMASLLDRAGLTIAAIDTTPSALARTQPDFWRSTEDLALRYRDPGGIWSVRLGSTVHGTMRHGGDPSTTPTFDAVGLDTDHRSFSGVRHLANVEISDRLASRFSLAQLAVPVGAALSAAPDPIAAVDLRHAPTLDRGRHHLAPAEPGVVWMVEAVAAVVEQTGRRKRR